MSVCCWSWELLSDIRKLTVSHPRKIDAAESSAQNRTSGAWVEKHIPHARPCPKDSARRRVNPDFPLKLKKRPDPKERCLVELGYAEEQRERQPILLCLQHAQGWGLGGRQKGLNQGRCTCSLGLFLRSVSQLSKTPTPNLRTRSLILDSE